MAELVLLDTNAIIHIAFGDQVREEAIEVMAAAAAERRLLVSPVSAWEIGNISRPRNTRRGIDFLPDAATWFARFLGTYQAEVTPLTIEAAIAAATLPDGLNSDPADRLLTATARELGAILVTRDRNILDYAELGHVRAVAC